MCSVLINNYNIFIELLGVIATLIIAITALNNISIIKKQQKESIKPKLFPINSYYVIRKNTNYIPFVNKQGTEIESEPIYAMNIANHTYKNVGLGPATTISIMWSYNEEKLVENLIEGANSIIRQSENYKHQLNYTNNNVDSYSFLIKPSKEEIIKIAAISPNEELSIKLPDTVLNYITFIAIKKKEENERDRIQIDIKDFKIEIVSKDVSGNIIKQIVNVKIVVTIFDLYRPTPGSDHGLIEIDYYD